MHAIDGNAPSSATLRISNEWNAGLLFKVKTTNPDRYALRCASKLGLIPTRYAVKPKMGFLAPDGCAEVTGALSTPPHGAECPVTRRACKTLEEHNVTDRFLVVFAPHTPPKKDAVISDLVRSPACSHSSHTSDSGRLSRVTTF